MNRIMLIAPALLAGSAFAGTGNGKPSADAGDRDAEVASAIAKTPQGVECRRGIIRLQARSNTEFVLGDAMVGRKQLAKTLRKAREETSFDCVVIERGQPTTKDVIELVGELSRIGVDHIEWAGAMSPR